MNFFKKLFGNSNDNNATASDTVRGKMSLFAHSIAKDGVQLTLDDNTENIPITSSYFGGNPYWPKDDPYPRSKENKPLVFLCQLNFAEIPPVEGFPSAGLLQFFIDDDDVLGCEFPSFHGNGFHIEYRTELEDIAQFDFDSLPEPYRSPLSNREQSRKVRFQTGTYIPDPQSFELTDKFGDEYLDTDDAQAYYDEFDANGPSRLHTIGGYPRFTQYEIRHTSTNKEYNTVLLHMGCDEHIMWGDVGEACFLIRPEDLKAKDFSKVLYSWDCC